MQSVRQLTKSVEGVTRLATGAMERMARLGDQDGVAQLTKSGHQGSRDWRWAGRRGSRDWRGVGKEGVK